MPQGRRGRGFKSSSRPSYFHRERRRGRCLDGRLKPDLRMEVMDEFQNPLNEGAKVSYEEVPNKGKTSAENLRVG